MNPFRGIMHRDPPVTDWLWHQAEVAARTGDFDSVITSILTGAGFWGLPGEPEIRPRDSREVWMPDGYGVRVRCVARYDGAYELFPWIVTPVDPEVEWWADPYFEYGDWYEDQFSEDPVRR